MKITVITVIKNNFKDIENTVKSVLFQKYKNLEYIIIDSNSTDGTSEYLFKIRDSRIRYYRSSDKSLYDGLNKAIRKSSGKFLCHLHSGDIFYNNNILSEVVKKIRNEDVYCGNIYFYKNNKIVRKWVHPFNVINAYNFYKVAHTAMFIKTSLIKNFYYQTKYKISSDIDLIILLLKKKYIFKYINLDITFMSLNGLSNNKKYFLKKITEDIFILYKNFNFLFLLIYFLKLFIKINDFNFIQNKITNDFIKQKKFLKFSKI